MKVKICCIKSKAELRLALDEGVRFVGFVSHMPSGPGIVSNPTIRQLANFAPSGVETFLLTCERNARAVFSHWQYCRTTAIQLCHPFTPMKLATVAQFAPQARLLPVVHINNSIAAERAHRLLAVNSSILLDTGSPNGKPPTLGGTGQIHDWRISQSICRVSQAKQIWLAGGLRAENVEAAIRTVSPYGVDVCSGVRTNDKLDRSKLREFLSQVKNCHG